MACPRSGAAARTTVDSKTTGGGDFATTGALATQELLAASRNLDFSTYAYVLQLQLNPDAAAADAKLADIVMTVTKRAVE